MGSHVPYDIVAVEGAVGFKISVLYSGKLQILKGEKMVECGILEGKNVVVGDLSFFLQIRKNATIISLTHSELLTLNRCDFIRLMQNFPHHIAVMEDLAKEKLETYNH